MSTMKLDTSQLKPVLAKLTQFIKKYIAFIVIVSFLLSYLYLVQLIGTLIQNESTATATESDLQPIKQLKIDKDAISRIQELETQNIEVQSLFEQARQNPFAE